MIGRPEPQASGSVVDDYLHRVERGKLLTAAEERRLACAASRGGSMGSTAQVPASSTT